MEQVICKVCSKIEGLHWYDRTNETLKKTNLCFSCNFWYEKTALKDDPSSVRIDGDYYWIGEIPDKISLKKFKANYGYYGREFKILFNDGREVVTNNLWHNGKIDPNWKKQLPDNATFAKE